MRTAVSSTTGFREEVFSICAQESRLKPPSKIIYRFSHGSSLKPTWSLIKSVISSKHSSYGPTAMEDNRGNTINNPQLITNKLNEFFTNIGLSVATKIPHSTVDHKSYLSGSFSDSLFASLTTRDEIINIVSSLKSSNSEGVDGIMLM